MADKEDNVVEQFKSKRALLLDYLEHASNVIAKKVTEVAIPERSIRPAKENKKTALDIAVVSDSPFIGEAVSGQENVIMAVPITSPEIIINPSDVDKLLYLRKKRDLLESVLLQDDKNKQEKNQPSKSVAVIEKPAKIEVKKQVEIVEDKPVKAVIEKSNKDEVEIKKTVEIVEPVLEPVSKIVAPSKNVFKTNSFELFTKLFKVEKKPKLKEKIVKEKIDPPKTLNQSSFIVSVNRLKKHLHRKGVRRLGRNVRRFAYGSATFALGFYLAYLLLVYSFAPRNDLFEQISSTVPAPALVSNYGLVDFYSYQQIKSVTSNIETIDDPSLVVLKWQIINSLADKYGIDKDLDQDLLLEVLKRKVVGDSSMNYYGSRKFIELKQAVRRGDALEKIAEKTGLTLHRATYSKRLAAQQFGDLIYGLSVNSLSPVIINDQGIYLLSILSSSDTKIDFNYLFVPARTLGQLVQEKLADAWIISLVD